MPRAGLSVAAAAAVLLMAALGAPRSVQAYGAPDLLADSSTRPEVTVRGDREYEETRVRAYVSRSIRQPFDDSLARWGDPVCPLVAGFSAEETERVLARLKTTVSSVGAELANGQCKPNFAVIDTDEPATVLSGWYRRDQYLFGDAGVMEVRHFLKTDLPVRVWYNIHSGPPRLTGLETEQILGAGGRPAPTIQMNDASRTIYHSVRAFSSVIVVIDRKQAAGLSADQLADYAAMVGLAEIDKRAGADTDPTILRLFLASNGERPAGLTSWDTSLLSALYHTDQKLKTQRWEIQTRVVDEVVKP
jgi:hypothetical protein